jgi:hypothetical protein
VPSPGRRALRGARARRQVSSERDPVHETEGSRGAKPSRGELLPDRATRGASSGGRSALGAVRVTRSRRLAALLAHEAGIELSAVDAA